MRVCSFVLPIGKNGCTMTMTLPNPRAMWCLLDLFRSFEEQLTTDGLPFFQETHLFASQEAQVETDPEEEFRHPSIPVELAFG